MTEKQKIKHLLPHGSYERIARAIGKSYGTVRDFFAPSNGAGYVSADIEADIIAQAKIIIAEQSLNGIQFVYGEDAEKRVRETLAA